MIMQLFDKDMVKIMLIFSITKGSKFTRNELKEKTGMNNVIIDNTLNALLQSCFLKKDKRLYSFNFKHSHEIKWIEDILNREYYETKALPLEIYFLIIDLLYSLKNVKGANVYFFGSYTKWLFRKYSDIDIAFINVDKSKVSKTLRKLEEKYNKKLDSHFFSKNFYKNKKDPLVKDILKNGIKLI